MGDTLSAIPIITFFQNLFTVNGTFSWDAVFSNLFSPFVLQGVVLTIILSVLAQFAGVLIGLLLYFMRRSHNVLLRGIAGAYIWFFRGTPLAVQVLFMYTLFGSFGLVHQLDNVGIFSLIGFQNVLFGSFVPALLALSFNEGAYMAEIVRAGIDSIEAGQMEAAKSLGMTSGLAMRRIVLPQAMRVIIPPLGNEFNNMLKSSSLAEFAGLYELFGTATHLGAAGFQILEFLVIASLWYLVLTTIWSVVQLRLERRFNAANLEPVRQKTWWNRVLGMGSGGGGSEIAAPAAITDRR